ncbi:MAG: thiamine ABC transporter substrate binding subunit [Alcaligenaceae bacterium]|nr:thiamine ABC transporter substrate binding subunit [Alcaligenaceae bacterium]
MKKVYRPLALALACATISYPAISADLPELNVYTYDSFASDWGPGADLKAGFEKTCQCTVKFTAFDGAGVLKNRLLLEGQNTKADVVIGLDQNMIQDFEGKSLFSHNQVDASILKLPFQWDASIYMPVDYAQYAFIYDSNKLKNPPQSLDDLVNNSSIRVIYQDPRTSSVGSGLLTWVNQVFAEKSNTAWQNLAKHTVTVGKGWSSSYGLFLKGESDVALSYVTSAVYHELDNKPNYKAAIFSEGHPYQLELMAITQNTTHPQLAKAFVQYILSDDAQTTIATKNVMQPVTAVKVKGYSDIQPAKALPIKLISDKTRQQWIDAWQSNVSQ